jgi:hypothetical protein
MNPNQSQVSGWQGMGPQQTPQLGQPGQMGLGPSAMNPTVQQILGGNNPYAVDQSPTASIQPAGSPNTSELASLGMLAMMA